MSTCTGIGLTFAKQNYHTHWVKLGKYVMKMDLTAPWAREEIQAHHPDCPGKSDLRWVQTKSEHVVLCSR